MTQEPRDTAPPPQTPEGDSPVPPEHGGAPPPQGAAAPPPQQSWQSQPQQPGPPPPAGGQQPGSGSPEWVSTLTSTTTAPGPAGTTLSDIPYRVVAIIIDAIGVAIVGFIVGAIIHPILGERFGFGGVLLPDVVVPSLLSSLVVTLIMLAATAAYFIYTWTRMNGSTLGMRLLNLRVVDASSGGVIGQNQAITRWALLGAPMALSFFSYTILGLLISIAALIWYIVLLITTAQSPTRQGLHDQYANTVVTKAPRAAA